MAAAPNRLDEILWIPHGWIRHPSYELMLTFATRFLANDQEWRSAAPFAPIATRFERDGLTFGWPVTRSAKTVRTKKAGLKVRESAQLSVPGSIAANPLRPRKLPRQARASATVEAILDAAADILEKHGFDAYTTNAIAERAGVSIGSLYQYFPNKTALTQALIAREDTALLIALDALREHSDTSALLPGLICIAVVHQLKRPVLARLLDAEEARLPPTEETQQLHAVLAAIFQRALGEELVSLEPRLFQDLFSIIQGMVDAAGQRGEKDGKALIRRVRRAVDGYLELLRRGAF